jgi:hypothetical protein
LKRDWQGRYCPTGYGGCLGGRSDFATYSSGDSAAIGRQGKEKAMIVAVRITKVDALSENFAY